MRARMRATTVTYTYRVASRLVVRQGADPHHRAIHVTSRHLEWCAPQRERVLRAVDRRGGRAERERAAVLVRVRAKDHDDAAALGVLLFGRRAVDAREA